MYNYIYVTLQKDLSLDQSCDKFTLKNLGHWLGLQTLAKDILVATEILPLTDIVLSAFHKDSHLPRINYKAFTMGIFKVISFNLYHIASGSYILEQASGIVLFCRPGQEFIMK